MAKGPSLFVLHDFPKLSSSALRVGDKNYKDYKN